MKNWRGFLRKLLNKSLQKRDRLFDTPYYRLIHGEGDRLPGLVVDRYGDFLAVQSRNLIMQERKQMIVTLLSDLLSRWESTNAATLRWVWTTELERNTGLLCGKVPDSIEIEKTA